MQGKSEQKIVYMETNSIVREDGQILKLSEYKKIKVQKEEEYFKMYTQDLVQIFELPSQIGKSLYYMLTYMEKDNTFILNSNRKEDIAEKAGTTVGNLNNNIQKLVAVQLLKRIGRSQYYVNPNLITKCAWEETLQKRQDWEMLITYKANGTKEVKGRPKQ